MLCPFKMVIIKIHTKRKIYDRVKQKSILTKGILSSFNISGCLRKPELKTIASDNVLRVRNMVKSL